MFFTRRTGREGKISWRAVPQFSEAGMPFSMLYTIVFVNLERLSFLEGFTVMPVTLSGLFGVEKVRKLRGV